MVLSQTRYRSKAERIVGITFGSSRLPAIRARGRAIGTNTSRKRLGTGTTRSRASFSGGFGLSTPKISLSAETRDSLRCLPSPIGSEKKPLSSVVPLSAMDRVILPPSIGVSSSHLKYPRSNGELEEGARGEGIRKPH